MDRPIDKICVRLCDMEGVHKASYYSTNYSETLKMFNLSKELDIPVNVRLKEDEEEIQVVVEDIDIMFGNNDNLLSLNIYTSAYEWEKE